MISRGTELLFPPIELYADGSFCRELGLGAWAFSVPSLGLLRTGSSQGSTPARFELLAVLNGLEELLEIGRSDQMLNVFCDCEATIALINRLRDGQPLKESGKCEDRIDLLPRLATILSRRMVCAARCAQKSLDHQTCHRQALGRLREEITRDPSAPYRLALARQRMHLDGLAKEREPLLKRLSVIDEELSMAQAQVEALKAYLEEMAPVA